MLSDNIRLHFGKADTALRHKSAVVEQQMRVIAPVEHGARAVDLAPVGIGLAPEYGAPRLVERVEGAVFVLHKRAERRMVRLGVKLVGLAVELIVDLPAHDSAVLAVVPRQLLDDPGRETAVYRRIVVILPPGAVPEKRAVPEGVEHLGVLFRQPGRGRRCRGTEDDLHLLLLAEIEEFVEEVKVKVALARLEDCPGKFRHAHGGDPSLLHAAQILAPQGFRPVLGVIAHAQGHFPPLKSLCLHHELLASSVSFIISCFSQKASAFCIQ